MNQEKLIHVPPAGKGREGDRGIWVSQLHCFWRGEQWLTQSFGLEKVYPDLEVLFRTYLLVPNAGADHYISEARALTKLERTPLSQIERVFVALTSQVKAGGLDTRQKDEIRSLDIIPVTSPGDAFRNLVAVSAETPWLIADRENLRDQFRSVLPLCMFEPAFVLKIKPLLVAIGLGDRILSELVTSITEAEGEAEFHKDLTKKYRKRSKYLFRYVNPLLCYILLTVYTYRGPGSFQRIKRTRSTYAVNSATSTSSWHHRSCSTGMHHSASAR